MKLKRITFLILLIACTASTACSDWTDTEAVKNTVIKPWEQGPELWAQYTEALRAYKQREHFLGIAHFDNAPAVATGE